MAFKFRVIAIDVIVIESSETFLSFTDKIVHCSITLLMCTHFRYSYYGTVYEKSVKRFLFGGQS